jgi:hypothetical protein
MATMQTQKRPAESRGDSVDWAKFDMHLAESRFYLERARVRIAEAEILRLEEELQSERARRRCGLFGGRS